MYCYLLSFIFIIVSINSMLTALPRSISSLADVQNITGLGENVEELSCSLNIWKFDKVSFDLSDFSKLTKLKKLTFTVDHGWPPSLEVRELLLFSLPKLETLEELKLLDFFQDVYIPHLHPAQVQADTFLGLCNKFPALRILEISENQHWSRTWFTNVDLSKILLLQKLEVLSLDGVYLISDSMDVKEEIKLAIENIKLIKQLPNLRILNLSRNNMTYGCGDVVALLLSPSNIEKLIIRYTSIRDLPTANEPNLSLKYLDASKSGVDISCLKNYVPQLEELILNDSTLCELTSFSQLPHLSKLHTQGFNLTEEQLEQLTWFSFQSLEYWDLTKANTKAIPFDTLVPTIKVLNLSNTNLTNINKIVPLQHLEELNCEGTKISAASIKKFAKIASLKKLVLNNTSMRDADFTALQNLTQLESLELRDINLSFHDLEQLQLLTQLKLLDIRGLKNLNIAQEHYMQLKSSLPNCQVLHN